MPREHHDCIECFCECECDGDETSCNMCDQCRFGETEEDAEGHVEHTQAATGGVR